MKTLVGVLALTALLVGCASQEEIRRRDDAARAAQSRLYAAQASNTVQCPDKRTCDKAFSLTKVYIQDNSDMRVQMSDDTMVSTYGPTQYGYAGLRATKVPGAGDSATIELVVACKGMDDSMFFKTECANKVARIYEGFKPFVESRMKQ